MGSTLVFMGGTLAFDLLSVAIISHLGGGTGYSQGPPNTSHTTVRPPSNLWA